MWNKPPIKPIPLYSDTMYKPNTLNKKEYIKTEMLSRPNNMDLSRREVIELENSKKSIAKIVMCVFIIIPCRPQNLS